MSRSRPLSIAVIFVKIYFIPHDFKSIISTIYRGQVAVVYCLVDIAILIGQWLSYVTFLGFLLWILGKIPNYKY